MKKLRIGFLVDKLEVDWYTYDLIEYTTKNRNFFTDITLISGYKNTESKRNFVIKFIKILRIRGFKDTFNLLLNWIPRRIIQKIERRKVRDLFPNYLKEKSLKLLNLKKIDISGKWSKKEIIFRADNESIKTLKKNKFDIIIRCGSGILKGEILSVAEFGIISFHHGDNRVNRGGPSGFWEVFFNQPSSGFIIQQLTETLDNGNILLRGNIITSNLWLLNNAFLIEKSQYFMKKILSDISKNNKLKFEKKTYPENLIILKDNSFLIFWRYIIKIYFPIIFKKLYLFLAGSQIIQWNVAFKREKEFKSSFSDYIKIKNPQNRFLADPFLISHKGREICFVEDYSLKKNKGRISAIELHDDQYKFLGIVLEENFHMSYPYVFKVDNNVYMIPETHAIGEIRLYKSTKFPERWRLEKILKQNVSAVDTAVFKKNENWFMLTNVCSSGINEHNSELHIFFSKNLISEEWLPIESGNPVIFDSQRARNGGFFVSENKFYRVNQIHSKGQYGRKFGINLINEINKKRYDEQQTTVIEPSFFENAIGTHHFHSSEKYNVIDFSKMKSLVSSK